MVTYHSFPVDGPHHMGIAVLRHIEGLATGADDGLCCSCMLPKKMLLQPILGGEPKAQTGQRNLLAAASATGPAAS